MSKKANQPTNHYPKTTPTFLLELPLQAYSQQARHLRGHFEAARYLYNALLGEAVKRLRRMRAESRWQQARLIPRSDKPARTAAFAALRKEFGFSEYALHAFATQANTSWIADHVDANTAQTLATRAYHAANRVCVGKARRVRRREQGTRARQPGGQDQPGGDPVRAPAAPRRQPGLARLGEERISALIDWPDPVVLYGLLRHRIKYVRLLRRKASSPRAKGVDRDGYRYSAQLALEGVPYQKPKHPAGQGTMGLDLDPSTIAIVPRAGEARLGMFCAAIAPKIATKRRLQCKLDRQRRANNPQNYDEQGRCKKGPKTWHDSQGYQATRQRLAHQERTLAAQRKSLHGQLAHAIVAVGDTIITEQISYRAWQRQFGRSVGLRAPGMFIEMLRRTGASHGRHPGRSPHTAHQALAVLSWLWQLY